MDDASTIIKSMARKYQECTSYADSGSLVASDQIDSPIEFVTKYLQPDKFRFTWRSHHPYSSEIEDGNESCVWSDGSSAYSKYYFQKDTIRTETLRNAVGAAMGVSRRTIYDISTLLMPNLFPTGHAFSSLDALKIAGESDVMNEQCLHLIGTMKFENDTELWISTQRHCLRKIIKHKRLTPEFMQSVLDDLRRRGESLPEPQIFSETREYDYLITYDHIAFDTEIDPSMFVQIEREHDTG